MAQTVGPGQPGQIDFGKESESKKKTPLQQEVQEVAQRLRIVDTASEGSSSTTEVVSIPPPSTPPASMDPKQVFECAELAQLASMAEGLEQGGILPSERGSLEATGRPRSIVNLTMFTEKSPENARAFLGALAKATLIATTTEARTQAQKALQDFASSSWFKEVLKHHPEICKDMVETGKKILGPKDEANRSTWDAFLTILNDSGLTQEASEVQKWLETPELLKSVVSFAGLIHEKGVRLEAGGKKYFASPVPSEKGTKALRFYVFESGEWNDIGGVLANSQTGQAQVFVGKQFTESLPPALYNCLTAFVTKSPEIVQQSLESLAKYAKSEGPKVQEKATTILLDLVATESFQDALRRDQEVGDALVTRSLGILGYPIHENKAAWLAILGSLHKGQASLAEERVRGLLEKASDVEKKMIQGVISFAGLIPENGIEFEVDGQTYKAMPVPSGDETKALRFSMKEGEAWKEIGDVQVDSRTGQTKVLVGQQLSDFLSPALHNCLTAFVTKSPKIVQQFLESLAKDAQSEDSKVQEKATTILLDLVATEPFQDALRRDQNVGEALVTQSQKILGIPSEKNKDAWLAILWSLYKGQSSSAAEKVEESLKEVSAADIEVLQSVVSFADLIHEDGMMLEAGGQTYKAMPDKAMSEPWNYTREIRFSMKVGEEWKEIGNVHVYYSIGQAKVHAGRQLSDFPPLALRNCLMAFSTKPLYEIIQQSFESLVQDAQNKDSKVREKAKTTLLDLVAKESFQDALRRDQKVEDLLVTQSLKILGTPSYENKKAWKAILESLHKGEASSAETRVQVLLQEVLETDIKMLKSVVSFAGLIPENGMMLEAGGQTYKAMSSSSRGNEFLNFYVKVGEDWDKIGLVQVDSFNGQAKVSAGQQLKVPAGQQLKVPAGQQLPDFLPLALRNCLMAFSTKPLYEIMQQSFESLVQDAQNKDSKVREKAKTTLLDLVAKESFQDALRCDQKVGDLLVTQSLKILGTPNEKNKDAWLAILWSLDKAQVSPAVENVRKLLQEVLPLSEVTSEKLKTMSKMTDALVEDGVNPSEARRIAQEWARQWEGCIVEGQDPRATVLQQYRGEDRIEGLKVRGALGDRYADYYTFGIAGSGGAKRVKKMVTITPDGQVIPMVRYTNVEGQEKKLSIADAECEVRAREDIFQKGMEQFHYQPGQEEEAREFLFKNILTFEKLESHIAKSGLVKVRYVAGRADGGALFDGVYVIHGENYDFLNVEERKKRLPSVLHGCVGALSALKLLHKLGLVHKDVKLENILLDGDVGKLADFGFYGPVGQVTVRRRTKRYSPPEMSVERCPNATSMDMFSFGSMLLCVFDHDGLNFELGRLNINLCNQAISLETYRTELQQIQRKLRTKGNDPWCLIADCIDFDPTKRPTSEQAEGRLMAVEATLKSSKTGTFEIPAPPAQTT